MRRRTKCLFAVALLCALLNCACGVDKNQIVGKWQQDQPAENANVTLKFDGIHEYKADGTLSYVGTITMFEKRSNTTRVNDVVWKGTWAVQEKELTQNWQARTTKTLTVNKTESYSGASIPAAWDLSQQMPPTQVRTIKQLSAQFMILDEGGMYQYHYKRLP